MVSRYAHGFLRRLIGLPEFMMYMFPLTMLK
jgi:hypothetical protein